MRGEIVMNLAAIKIRLLEERDQILQSVRSNYFDDIIKDPEEFKSEDDASSSNAINYITAKLGSRQYGYLKKVEAALKRLDKGNFGICLDCEDTLSEKRLLTRPAAEFCIECQTDRENTKRKDRAVMYHSTISDYDYEDSVGE